MTCLRKAHGMSRCVSTPRQHHRQEERMNETLSKHDLHDYDYDQRRRKTRTTVCYCRCQCCLKAFSCSKCLWTAPEEKDGFRERNEAVPMHAVWNRAAVLQDAAERPKESKGATNVC